MWTVRVLRVWLFVLLAGCGVNAPAPTAQPVLAVEMTVVATPETQTLTDSAVERGRLLFHQFKPEVGFACETCHYTTSDQRLIGPGLAGVAQRVQSYDIQMAVKDYLHASIIAPDEFLAPAEPAYPSGVMPRTYGEILTRDQIDDLVAFLLSLEPVKE